MVSVYIVCILQMRIQDNIFRSGQYFLDQDNIFWIRTTCKNTSMGILKTLTTFEVYICAVRKVFKKKGGGG